MHRRRFLQSGLSAGIAGLCGCTGRGEEPPEGARRRISVEAVTSEPGSASLDRTVTVTDEWITDESTARLETTTTNDGDSSERVSPAFYKGSSGDESDPGVLAYNVEAADAPPEDYVPPCFGGSGDSDWRPPVRDGDVEWTLETPPVSRLEPGESVSHTLLVADDPTADGCVPPGSYRFHADRYYQDGGQSDFTWTLDVTAVGPP